MALRDDLLALKDVGVKAATFHHDGALLQVEFFESKMPVVASEVPQFNDIPPDDVMLFAATEDIEELMKQRKAE